MKGGDFPQYSIRYWNILLSNDKEVNALDNAAHDLRRLAGRYFIISEFPHHLRGIAMKLIDERPYGFERNLSRWPDGRFRLLNRDYERWHRRDIALTEADLEGCCVRAWFKTKACSVGVGDNFAPLIDDVLEERPGDWLPPLAGILIAVADLMRSRAEALYGAERAGH